MTATLDDIAAPPQDIAAERAVLGACLNSADAYRTACELVSDEDWYRPAHLAMWRLMRTVAATGNHPDPVAVNGLLTGTDPETRRLVDAPLIAELFGLFALPQQVSHYAQLIAAAGLRRRLIATAQAVIQRAHQAADPAEVAEWAVTEMGIARDTQQTTEATDVDVHELIDERVTVEWVMPGLLARGDRFILTASAGLGKSTFLRQMAVCAAAGLDPFRMEHITPQRVLVVDCENGRMLSRDRYRPLVLKAERVGRPVEDRLRIDIRPSGLDLLRPSDVALLLRMVERTRPDLLLIGPAYRLHQDDPNDERAARKVTVVLDQARAATGCAVITEAHTPHTDGQNANIMRPFGSSLWTRWPEFGYCLKLEPDSDLTLRKTRLLPWRGPRDERQWPERLEAGGHWPWTEPRKAGR